MVFDIATSPLWTNLCRSCIVGRFSPYEEALVEAVEGGDYELTGGRVMWGCHGVSRGLLRPTPVSGRDILFFGFQY